MLKEFNFQTKIFLYYSLIITFIITVTLVIFYSYISKTLKERSIDNQEQLAGKTSVQVDQFIAEMDRIALYSVSNPTVQKYFSTLRYSDPDNNALKSGSVEYHEISQAIFAINLPNAASQIRTSIYNINGDYISMGLSDSFTIVNQRLSDPDSVSRYQDILNHSDYRVILPPHKDFWSDDDLILISLIREIQDFSTYASYGLVEVQKPYASLEEIMHLGDKTSLKAYLFDNNGTLIYPSDNPLNYLSEYHYETFINQRTDEEIVTIAHSPDTGWNTVIIESEESLLSPIRLIGNVIIVIGIVLMIITIAVVYFISDWLSKPLKMMKDSVKDVTLKNLSLEIAHPNSSNEILQLNEAFEAMFSRLEESMDELVKTKAQEMKAHMIALQSQMNPHFLYNMLAIISASSRESGDSRITEICIKLSNMLRYISSYEDDSSSLIQELNHTTDYLKLMSIRFEDQLQYHVHVDPTIQDSHCTIPKLTVQPIVENCFQHGFKQKMPPWQLNLSTYIKDDFWYIEVTDNGSGIDESTISALITRVDVFVHNPATNIKDLKLGGMGLTNTLVRMKLLYKEDMIFRIERLSTEGTKVILGGKVQ